MSNFAEWMESRGQTQPERPRLDEIEKLLAVVERLLKNVLEEWSGKFAAVVGFADLQLAEKVKVAAEIPTSQR